MEEIKKLLKEHNANYELIYNDKKIFSIDDGKKYFNIEEIAPTLIMEIDDINCAFITSAAHGKIDFNYLKKSLKCNKVKLANKNNLESLIGFSAGNIPLVGLPITYYLDSRLLTNEYLIGGSGVENYTLKIKVTDLIKINKPIIIDLAK